MIPVPIFFGTEIWSIRHRLKHSLKCEWVREWKNETFCYEYFMNFICKCIFLARRNVEVLFLHHTKKLEKLKKILISDIIYFFLNPMWNRFYVHFGPEPCDTNWINQLYISRFSKAAIYPQFDLIRDTFRSFPSGVFVGGKILDDRSQPHQHNLNFYQSDHLVWNR